MQRCRTTIRSIGDSIPFPMYFYVFWTYFAAFLIVSEILLASVAVRITNHDPAPLTTWDTGILRRINLTSSPELIETNQNPPVRARDLNGIPVVAP